MLTEMLAGGMNLGTTIAQMRNVDKTNAANAANVDKTNALTKSMSDTAHQREVADLRLAGLNPRLSAGGSGASSPGMQTQRDETKQFNDPTPAVFSAVSAKLAKEQFDQQKIMQAQDMLQKKEDLTLTKLKQDTEQQNATNIQEDTFNKVQNNKMLELTYGDKADVRQATLRNNLYNQEAQNRLKQLQFDNDEMNVNRGDFPIRQQQQGFEYQKSRFQNKNGKYIVPINEVTSQIGNILSVATGAKGLMLNGAKNSIKRESYNGMGEHTGTTYTTKGGR